MRWDSLGLSPELLNLVETAGFASPTEIQARTIPLALDGNDLIASAKTGSGKTAAFSLPLIEKLKGRRGTLGLVLAPTREIALQTLETMKKFGEPLGITSIALIGGTDVKADEKALAAYPHVIVGTPGRICDHLERGNLWLEFIEYLVLDEADRMLDMGFAKEVNRIVNELPANRQTLLFSATIPPSIDKLCHEILHQPERVAIGSALSVNRNVSHEVLWVPEKSRRRELIRFLERQAGTAIVFTKTKDDCTHLWRSIHAAGIHESTYISSNKSQAHREEALEGFKAGRYRVLVATDVAGRGIHVENVSCVVNFGVPEEPEDYIHRVGRTGRKDQQGKAITFATPAEAKKIRRIEEVLKEKLPSRYARGLDAESLGHPRVERSDRAERGRGESRSSRGSGRGEGGDRHRRRGEEDRSPARRAAAHRDEPAPRNRSHREEDREPRARHRDEPPSRYVRGDRNRDHREDRRGDRFSERDRHRDEPLRRSSRHEEREPRVAREDVHGRSRSHRDERPARHSREHREDRDGREPRHGRSHRDDRERDRPRDETLRREARHRDEPRDRHRDVPRDRHREERDPRPRHRDDRDWPELRPERSHRDDRDEARPRRSERSEVRGHRERPLRETRDDHRESRREPRRDGQRDSGREPRRDDRHSHDREERPREHAAGARDADRDELLALEAEAWQVANQERHPGVWGREEEAPERPFVHAAWELARARDARKAPASKSAGGGRGGRAGKSSGKSAPKGGRSGGRGRRR